jgi:hypothetical protein
MTSVSHKGLGYIPGAVAGCEWIMVGCWDVLVGMIMQVKRVPTQLFVLEQRVDAAMMIAMRPARGEKSLCRATRPCYSVLVWVSKDLG